MKTFKARGVVLREYEAGESDKRLVLLCKDIGRLTVYARGARKLKSKFMAAAQIFTYGDYVISDGGAFYALAQAEVIDSFYGVRDDYASLCHAHYIAEICEKTVMDNTPCDDLLRLLLRTLSHLSRRTDARFIVLPEQAACVFLFRFFKHYGLSPETDACTGCGWEPPENEGVFFCDEGICCPRCAAAKPYKVPLSAPALAALRYILDSETTRAFLFNTKGNVLNELTRAGRLFLAAHFQIKINSEELLP